MDILKKDKSATICTFACLIPIICYGLERLGWYCNIYDKTMGLILAIVFTILAALNYLTISKISNSFYGLFAAMLSFKMMPPDIPALSIHSIQGGTVYVIVQTVCLILFAIVMVKHLRNSKNTDNPIDILPVAALMFTLPMLNEFINSICSHLYVLSGTMYGVYFTQFIFYFVAVGIIFAVTYRSNDITVKFVCSFQIVAMIINIARRFGTIAALLIKGEHISNSYYCWILIYVIVIGIFSILQKKKFKVA